MTSRKSVDNQSAGDVPFDDIFQQDIVKPRQSENHKAGEHDYTSLFSSEDDDKPVKKQPSEKAKVSHQIQSTDKKKSPQREAISAGSYEFDSIFEDQAFEEPSV